MDLFELWERKVVSVTLALPLLRIQLCPMAYIILSLHGNQEVRKKNLTQKDASVQDSRIREKWSHFDIKIRKLNNNFLDISRGNFTQVYTINHNFQKIYIQVFCYKDMLLVRCIISMTSSRCTLWTKQDYACIFSP